jgi:hypothetical protein
MRSLTLAFWLTACGPALEASPDPVQDQDGDGILDVHEGDADPDRDGVPAYRDSDSDGDDLADAWERGDDDPMTLPLDSDGDRIPDFLDPDADNNGLPDGDEGLRRNGTLRDTDGDGEPDAIDPDNDGDGLPDVVEMASDDEDSDRDGKPDHLDPDSDGDGVGDRFEGDCADAWRGPCDTDGDGVADVHDDDSDDDSRPDVEEGPGELDTDPPDTDRDGTPDYRDGDSDGDGLTDRDELESGLDPSDRDSDGDGFSDGAERQMGTDPADGSSTWNGHYVEVGERREREESFLFDLRFSRLDVMLLWPPSRIDANFPGLVSEIVNRLQARVADVAIGFATEGSYGTCPWSLFDGRGCLGVSDDVAAAIWEECRGDPSPPLHRRVAPTAEHARVLDALRDLTVCQGRLASMEALQQVALDTGFDLNCDGVFDPSDDLLPFRARPDDAFGGKQGEVYNPALDEGALAGVGFRSFSSRVVVHTTITGATALPGISDPPDLGTEFSNVAFFTTPSTCPRAASLRSAADALKAADIVRVHLNVGENLLGTASGPPLDLGALWRQFAFDSGSGLDLDGDGDLDPLYFEVSEFPWDIPPTFADDIAEVVAALERKMEFERLSLVVEGDPYGLVASVDPEEHRGFKLDDDDVAFTVRFRGTVPSVEGDRVFKLYLNAVGDERLLLAREPVIVVIPGRQGD